MSNFPNPAHDPYTIPREENVVVGGVGSYVTGFGEFYAWSSKFAELQKKFAIRLGSANFNAEPQGESNRTISNSNFIEFKANLKRISNRISKRISSSVLSPVAACYHYNLCSVLSCHFNKLRLFQGKYAGLKFRRQTRSTTAMPTLTHVKIEIIPLLLLIQCISIAHSWHSLKP